MLSHVDDMIIKCSDNKQIFQVKKLLNKNFQITDLGKLIIFLSIKVVYSKKGYLLLQMKFVSNLVEKSGIIDDKIVETPETFGVKMKIDDRKVLKNFTLFHQLVEALPYLTIT